MSSHAAFFESLDFKPPENHCLTYFVTIHACIVTNELIYCSSILWLFVSFGRVEKCRFFDSKMRPLLLVYENEDNSLRLSQTDPSPFSEIKLIFKCGDG